MPNDERAIDCEDGRHNHDTRMEVAQVGDLGITLHLPALLPRPSELRRLPRFLDN